MSDADLQPQLSARAARFACRIAGDSEPAFADWQRQRRIDRLIEGHRHAIAELVALLDARPAIDAELNGTRLGALASHVGEAQFDLVCDAALATAIYERGSGALPDPHMLQALGEAILQNHQRSVDALQLARIAADIDATCNQGKLAA
jgi:hypothetical protein